MSYYRTLKKLRQRIIVALSSYLFISTTVLLKDFLKDFLGNSKNKDVLIIFLI